MTPPILRGIPLDGKYSARFWSRVDRGHPDSCWNWIGAFSGNGYGSFCVSRKNYRAHRIAFLLTHGTIPGGADVCHTCDNPACCNPAHLYAGDARTNARDMVERGRWGGGPGFPAGEINPGAKLANAQAAEIRTRYAAGGLSMEAIARDYGVHENAVWRIVHGVSYAAAVGVEA